MVTPFKQAKSTGISAAKLLIKDADAVQQSGIFEDVHVFYLHLMNHVEYVNLDYNFATTRLAKCLFFKSNLVICSYHVNRLLATGSLTLEAKTMGMMLNKRQLQNDFPSFFSIICC